jgi:hypothetical protein
MKIPVALLFDFTLITQFPPFPPATVELLTTDGLLYQVNKPAAFLEGSFQYDLCMFSSLSVSLWFKGSWLSLRGTGNWNYDFTGRVFANGVLVPPPTFDSQQRDDTATYTRHALGGGLSAVCTF